MNDFFQNILKLDKKKTVFLLILLVIGIILFSLSEYNLQSEESNSSCDYFDEDTYVDNLETKLGNIISKISGVSNVSVMVTLDSSESFSYVSEKTSSVSKDTSQSNSSIIYKEDKGGDKTPVLSEIKTPEIKGVSVVCSGGNNTETRLKIINLISSTLNLSKNRIFVTE